MNDAQTKAEMWEDHQDECDFSILECNEKGFYHGLKAGRDAALKQAEDIVEDSYIEILKNENIASEMFLLSVKAKLLKRLSGGDE